MPKFTCLIKDKQGKSYKNIVDGPNAQTVIDKLQKQDYYVVNIKQLSVPSVQRKMNKGPAPRRFSKGGIELQDIVSFARQLATMLEAGVTLLRSLDVILSQIRSEKLYKIIYSVKQDVEHGSALSLALSKHPKVFNQFWVSLIEVGEASGTIPAVLNKLTFYLEQQATFNSTVISGIIYPAILFGVSMCAVLFFALFVAPRFESIFTQMGAQLPLLTLMLLATFKFLKNQFFLIAGIIFVLIVILKKYVKTYQGRLLYEKFLFSMPAIGEVYKNIIVERFASQMALLIESGVPILQALDITERLVDNHTCALIIDGIKDGVRKGELLVAPMEASGFFPVICIQMIMVGEETGKLSKMLKHVAKYYQEHVEVFMKRFSTIIEPFMLVFMGGVIGVIVLSMFLPMFNIAQLGGGGG